MTRLLSAAFLLLLAVNASIITCAVLRRPFAIEPGPAAMQSAEDIAAIRAIPASGQAARQLIWVVVE